MLKELYKNDPEYLKYLESTKQKTDTKIFQPGNTDDATKKVYGADFFNNNSFDLSDKAPSAPPLDYRLGPGDELIVALWDAGELQKSYTIAKDGSIFPQLVGKIYVQGMTLDAASKLIATRCTINVRSAAVGRYQASRQQTDALVAACLGDRAKADRLALYEKKKAPFITDAEARRRALERLTADRR